MNNYLFLKLLNFENEMPKKKENSGDVMSSVTAAFTLIISFLEKNSSIKNVSFKSWISTIKTGDI